MKKSLVAIFFISNISFCQTVEEYFNSANEKAKIENLSGAIEDYNKAIELNPNFAVAYFNRGFIKAKQNNFIDAVEDYSKYISLKPNSPKAYSIRAFAYARINKNKEAIQDYSTYIEYLPEDNDVINSRGLLRQTIGDFKGALNDFNKAIELDSLNPLFHKNKGNLLLKMNRNKEGRIELEIAKELNPSGNASRFNRLGLFYPNVELEERDELKFPIEVDIELFINDIQNFDTDSNRFFLRFKYALYSKYSPNYVSQIKDSLNELTDLRETINVDYIKSSETRINDLKYDFFEETSGHQYSGSLEGSFYHNWDLRDYPFDNQKVEVRFKSKLDSTIFKFKESKRYPSDYNKNMTGLKDGFEIENITFRNDFEEDFKEIELSPTLTRKIVNPIGVYEILISRSGSWLFLKLFLGSFLAFIMSLLVFKIPKTNFESRIDLSVGAIFGAIGNKYFVESTTSAVQVLTKADIINNLVILMVLFNVIIIIIQNNNKINFDKFYDSKFSFIFSAITLFVLTILTILI